MFLCVSALSAVCFIFFLLLFAGTKRGGKTKKSKGKALNIKNLVLPRAYELKKEDCK
jgi:hypothetical protein